MTTADTSHDAQLLAATTTAVAYEGTEQCRALLLWASAHKITVTDGGECGDPACCGFITMRCRVPRHLIATLPSGWDWEE